MIITASTLDASATRLAELLGNYTPAPLLTDDRATLRLANPDGYTIGARARVDGTTLQLWVTAPGTKAKLLPGLQPLQPGRSYHTVLQLAGLDGDLGDTIHAAIADRLLPAIALKPRYVGHRPWEQEPAPTDTDAATPAPTAPSETSEPAGAEPAEVEAAEPAEPATDTPVAVREDSSNPDTDAATAQSSRAPEAARPARKRTTTKNPTPAADTKPSKARTTTAATSSKPTRATPKKTTTPRTPATDAKPTRTRSATKKTTSPTKPPRTRKATATPAKRRTPAAETP
ncbi:hypothetical protein [Kitasatospora purpeofusca]|uniref:hypothetical protein n=1 Tax=Kitasatospora purpeofusca TaxID=67352 RepID=UPI0038188F7A